MRVLPKWDFYATLMLKAIFKEPFLRCYPVNWHFLDGFEKITLRRFRIRKKNVLGDPKRARTGWKKKRPDRAFEKSDGKKVDPPRELASTRKRLSISTSQSYHQLMRYGFIYDMYANGQIVRTATHLGQARRPDRVLEKSDKKIWRNPMLKYADWISNREISGSCDIRPQSSEIVKEFCSMSEIESVFRQVLENSNI